MRRSSPGYIQGAEEEGEGREASRRASSSSERHDDNNDDGDGDSQQSQSLSPGNSHPEQNTRTAKYGHNL